MRDQNLCLKTGEWLLPGPDVDLTAWACVACDQYTSQPKYWEEVAALVGQRPSAFHLILPECYLPEAASRIPAIHARMRADLASGVLTTAVKDGFILTERSTGAGARLGLIVEMDLEGYDFRPGTSPLIRPTEGTVLERIPPRLQVRRGAAIEMSHVLMLIDDPMQSVVEPLYVKRGALEKLYDFPLMMEGGHLVGYAVTATEDIQAVFDALNRLKNSGSILYAVGDGNHSLAAAKACWEEVKPGLTQAQRENHPARYAMVELTNIRDDALQCEPIHRVLFGYDGDMLLSEWETYAAGHGMSLAGGADAQEIVCVFEGKEVTVSVAGATQPLAVGTLQRFLDDFVAAHPGLGLDYVHGEAAVRELTAGEKAIGFLLPPVDKGLLFPALQDGGVLPRKTFSLGEANEKRYYMEARRL